MYRIAICDDDRRFAQKLRQRIENVLTSKGIAANLDMFHDTASLLERIRQGVSFDLLFLDILLDGEDGYSFAKYLRDRDITTDIVFISTTEAYAVRGYDVSPLLYLLKPVQDEQLAYAFDLFLKKHRPQRVLLNLPGKMFSINLGDLMYCEVFGHTISLHLVTGEVRELRHPLSQLEKLFPTSLFVRSHQSYLVNMAHIKSIVRYELTLSSGQTLPISQSKYMDLQNKFIQYASHQKLRI